MFRFKKPKNTFSQANLRNLHAVLEKNTTVSENNSSLLVESLRSIAEILIWGDQNDSSVFDFFLEKNMFQMFNNIFSANKKSGGSNYVCVQLLQTLNILFENIRNETSLYYLLSNNHVNSIIVHKFDFSDEDVMGYYILFLKTLSMKLTDHTVHFFFNENTNDFPLYTEAIKFFNHPESMVRIAVRTISLNVYRISNKSMLEFIRDRTAAPYFSNLVWFIGKHILDLDACLQDDSDHQSQHRLTNMVAEHLDNLHYLNDILLLNINDLNAVLTEHLLHKLFVPLYILSLTSPPVLPPIAKVTKSLAEVLNKVVDIDEISNPRVSPVVALYLLSLVFLVITHAPLVFSLAWVILNGDCSVFKEGLSKVLHKTDTQEAVSLGFLPPNECLEEALCQPHCSSVSAMVHLQCDSDSSNEAASSNVPDRAASSAHQTLNVTDEEKEIIKEKEISNAPSSRPFLDICLSALECTEDDYKALLALCLIFSIFDNSGLDKAWLESILNSNRPNGIKYKTYLVDKLLNIVSLSSQPSRRIRLVTLELALKVLTQIIESEKYPYSLFESQEKTISQAQAQVAAILRTFYRSEEIFLDLFEDEYNELKKSKLNVEFLCMDSTILLQPTGTPMTGINFARRLPCGDVEKARRALRAYLFLRNFSLAVKKEDESQLPLTKTDQLVQVENVLDLNNSDLIACTVILKDNTKFRRFLVIDVLQLILVEPDSKRLGWGVAKFVGLLQDVEVTGDKDDSRCLHLTIHRGGGSSNRSPILSAKFIFDDHIRCMAAKQRLTKGRTKARHKKMLKIAQLLEIQDTPISDKYSSSSAGSLINHHRPLFSVAHRIPGVASAFSPNSPTGMSRAMVSNRPIIDGSTIKHPTTPKLVTDSRRSTSTNRSMSPNSARLRSRESSPQTVITQNDIIPLETLSRSSTPGLSNKPMTPPSSSLSQHFTNLCVGNEETPSIEDDGSRKAQETSFISSEDKHKRKGGIETV